jgi:hypothetical protein
MDINSQLIYFAFFLDAVIILISKIFVNIIINLKIKT